MDETVDLIRAAHRERRFNMNQRKRLFGALAAYLRWNLGWRPDKPDAERKRINAAALKMIEAGTGEWADAITDTRKGTASFEIREEATKKRMAKLARTLPVWKEFAKGVRGLGEVSLAVIVGEAGDLSNYEGRNGDAKLWKRMGLAPGQNRVPPGLSREARANAWIERGYNPRRRSESWVIADTLLSSQIRKVKDADGEDTGERVALGPYGEIYIRRKAYERARDPEMSDMHSHLRAQRCMEKRLLRDLWRAWRRAKVIVAERPMEHVPAASNRKDAA
jgi:hypothetical protein